ncbi:hypothetical protein SHELI_v1c09060 [Spiroplasma helicoides]|uniref:B3/B4 tRNA-binding domain-containing protein n=1 Tax=Spiroplasma helicoides TaxID=216938 RepID=A0A1B3SLN7_9MOLU|nr:phenylalanine--tRNA ligase beta subunit-related protein [Spiroplasma helicoides]AOG60855.1 hypothetical protein SHELI_v1c09060 [Spiroplasma helicoides]
MSKFKLTNEFLNIFPNVEIGVLVLKGIKNEYDDQIKYKNYLNQAIEESKKFITAEVFSENTIVQKWRNAYQLFKTKKGARSSIEALLKRVNNQSELNIINPLVDIYNCISLKFGVPCGGEDLDLIKGDILLTKANGNEEFITLGSDKSEPPYENEIIYKDEVGAICRCLNWRECTRTMLTEQTKNAVFFIEEIESDNSNFTKAVDELAKMFEDNFKVKSKVYILNKNKQEVEL